MKVLVAGWVGSTNLGDELVFAGMRRLLDGHQVAVITTDPAATRRVHGVGTARHDDPGALLRAVGTADAVVFGGGGIVQDVTSPLNLPYHLSRLTIARARRIPFAAVGLGVGGLETPLGRRLVRPGLRGAVGITVRDAASSQLLADVGVQGAELAADLAFALDPPAGSASAEALRVTDHLAVCLRPWSGKSFERMPAGMRGDITPDAYVAALADALDRTAAATGLAVRFVALQRDRDDAFHARVAERMSAPTSRCAPDLEGLLAEVARARAVVSMRYHGGVAAILAGLPTVLISYALKVDALARELGEGGRLLGWDPAEFASLPGAVSSVLDRGEVVVDTRSRLRERQRANAALVDRLLDVASGGGTG
ncbi:MAG: polysaccharide pyruvyl transferase family protein [Nitriliruptor sp.]